MENPLFSMGKSTISMAIFNSYVTNYQRVNHPQLANWRLLAGASKSKAFVVTPQVAEGLGDQLGIENGFL
jgi:hypothetical protein